MKKILLALLLIGIGLGAAAQGSVPVWGQWNYKFLTVDSTFAPPHYTTANRPAPGGKIQIIVNDDSAKLQYTVGSSWVTINGTAGAGTLTPGYGIKIVSTTISFDSANVRKQDSSWIAGDTLEFRINGGITYKYLVAASKIKYTDSAAMLAPYARSNTVVKFTDSAAMLANYLRRSDTTAMLLPYLRANLGVKYTDTSGMLLVYLRKSDTTSMLSVYARKNTKLDSITRAPGNDSVFQWTAGVKRFAFLDSISTGGGSCVGCLVNTNNLSDVSNVVTSRNNLGLGSAAVQNSTFFAQVANNLSDLANAATARTNLGLGSSATHPVADFLQSANNFSDVVNAATARTNLGLGSLAILNTVNNGNWSGTALSIANGGWGRTTALNGIVKGDGTTYGTVTIGYRLSYIGGVLAYDSSKKDTLGLGHKGNGQWGIYTSRNFDSLYDKTDVPDAPILIYTTTDSARHIGADTSAGNAHLATQAYVLNHLSGAVTPGGASGDMQWDSVGVLAGRGPSWDFGNSLLSISKSQNNEIGFIVNNSNSGINTAGSFLATNGTQTTKLVQYGKFNNYAMLPDSAGFLYSNSNTLAIFDDNNAGQLIMGVGAVRTAAQLRLTKTKFQINPEILTAGSVADSLIGRKTSDSSLTAIAIKDVSVLLDATQTYTSGATLTVTSGNNYVYINPASVQATLTLTLPTTWHNSGELFIVFGGTITSGNPVITNLTIVAGSGQTLVQANNPNGLTYYAGEVLQYKLNGTLDYRIQ